MKQTFIIFILFSLFAIVSCIYTFLPIKKAVPSVKRIPTIYWKDEFNALDTKRWNVPDREALEGSIRNDHQGYFLKNNVTIHNGYLIMKLNQKIGTIDSNNEGIISEGSELESKDVYGYGTYQWRARMSSTSKDPKIVGKTVSGQISAAFNFINNSETEIDFEIEGQYPNQLEMTTWKNPDTSKFPTSADRGFTFKTIPHLSDSFHTYKFIWKPDSIAYFIDNKQVAFHTEHVPQANAHFMMNHWGTNNEDFGGLVTLGQERYMIVDWVSYSSLN